MTAQSLQGRTAIVTGAGAGIGRAIALALAALGANVVAAVRRSNTGEETAALIKAEGGHAIAVQADVAQELAVQHAIDQALAQFGGLDIVIHNASSGLSGTPAALAAITDQMWDEQASVALDAAYHLARASFTPLKESGGGRYIILTSSQGLHGSARNPVYTAVKGAQRGFIKALAHEWGPYGITVNGVAPAALSDAAAAYLASNPAQRDAALAQFPLGRIGDPRTDVGAAIAALCTDDFRYVTGQTLCIDGGAFTLQ